MKNNHLRHILLLNFAVFCISTSGIMGRQISLPPPLTIWYRAVLALIFLGLFCWWKKYSFRFNVKKSGGTIFLTGVLMMIHWVTYFYALSWSNVAIALLSLFTFPLITTLLEPLFFKTKFQISHVYLGSIILLGIYFIAPSFDIADGGTKGLLMGLVSALAYAVRNLILKSKIDNFNGSILMFYQMAVTIFTLLPVLFIFEIDAQKFYTDLPFLLFLGLITTSVGHTLFLNSLKHFSVSTASILGSVQPIFGIALAVVFLGEIPTSRSMIGGALILLTVAIESRLTLKRK